MILEIGIDTGKNNTKAIMEVEGGEFISTIFPTSIRPSEKGDGDFITVYRNTRYIVGEESDKLSIEQSKSNKRTMTHKVCVLTAIANIIRQAEIDENEVEQVKITLNVPFNDFRNVEEREEMINFYEGFTDFIANEVEYKFELAVTPYVEGAPVAMKNRSKLGEDEVVIIDLGSHNTMVLTYGENKKPIPNKCRQRNKGMRKLLTEVNDEIRTKFDEEFDYKNLRKILMKEKKNVGEHLIQTAEGPVKEWLRTLKIWLKDCEINLDTSDVIIAGGGARMLKPYIYLEYGKDVIIDTDDIFANAKGSLLMFTTM